MITEFPHGLFVLRHCRTEYNASHRVSGQSDSSIIDFSIDTSALDLMSIPYQDLTIISSPLTRCVQTATYFLQQHCEFNSQIYTDSRIIERGMGCWEGKFKKDILNNYPQYCYHGKINPFLTPPCGETFNEFTTRIDEFIHDIQKMSQNSTILICAHNQSLKLLKYRLTKNVNLLDFWISFSLQNGKIERFY